ncbi:MAG TPA: SGNH/GDSL hydrolase family protein [Cyclobacteriaceae bacterium]|nr:SGNH/GDSL hydrolase family protein [Cyclobacteriaceae bacterium]
MSHSRRTFMKKAAFASAISVSIPEIVSAAIAKGTSGKVILEKGNTILFQGDSITDAGRNRDEASPNSAKALGNGYAFMASSQLLYNYAALDLKTYNKGISGNKVYQLAERWDEDCLQLKPDVLSILIGVNDYWHMRNGKYDGTIETYWNDFKALLERTKKALPNVKLIIGEPFAVAGLTAVDQTWFPAFSEYQAAAKQLAETFGAAFIPYQSIFDKAQKSAPGVYWTNDGVHPSIAGAQLMAHSWTAMIKR